MHDQAILSHVLNSHHKRFRKSALGFFIYVFIISVGVWWLYEWCFISHHQSRSSM